MKHLSILTLTIIALSSFMATTLQADSPHFVRGPTASLDTQSGDYYLNVQLCDVSNNVCANAASLSGDMPPIRFP
jgi:hypothetical protein